MRIQFLIFLLMADFAIGCPNEDKIKPCFCKRSHFFDQSVINCKDLENEAHLELITTSIAGMSGIRRFSILNSALNFIPTNAFKGSTLVEIEIINSSVISLTDSDVAFVGLENSLESFTMAGSSLLNNWDWSALRNLKKLSKIAIVGGDLEEIENMGEETFRSVKIINFSDNQINVIDDKAFASAENLSNLQLNDNQISKMKRSMLPDPALALMLIDLRFNNIESFPGGMFSNIPRLQNLMIGGNKILALEEKVFSSIWPYLTVFEAKGNQLRCDCRLSWILKQSSPMGILAFCVQPVNLNGKNIADLQSTDLYCHYSPN